MGRGKHHRALWLAAAGLLAVLLTVAWLQYRWIEQLHDAESERRSAGLAAGLEAFREAFDEEIYSWQKPLQWSATWIANRPQETILPEYLAPMEYLATLQRLWVAAYFQDRTVAGVTMWYRLHRGGPAVLLQADEPMIEWLEPLIPEYSNTPLPLDDETLALVVPAGLQVGEMPPDLKKLKLDVRSVLVVLLDKRRFVEEMIDPLARRHLPPWSDGFDYSISVSDESSGESQEQVLFASPLELEFDDLESADAEIGLLTTKSLAAIFLGAATEGESIEPPWCGEGTDDSLDDSRACASSFLVFPGGGPGPQQWILRVRLRDGSLASVIDRLRTRNLAISLTSLGVLAACLIFLGLLVLRAERLARAQLEFVTGVSHDLRTPLSVIQQAAANLADGVVAEPEEVRGYGSLVRREGRRLQEMIERILTYAGLTAQKVPLTAVELPPLVERVVARFRGEIHDREVEVATRLPTRLPPVRANAAALESAIQNLLSNALKYGEAGGRVEIDAAFEAGPGKPEVRLGVRDWGPGIDPQDRRHLFEPFYRGQRARDSQLPGTGLGLSLVWRVVRLFGGRVRVEAAPGGGSIFHLHLPAASLEAES